MRKVLIIITGGPGTGKSYMTRRILKDLEGLTVLSYDDIKEKNFDRFGYDDEEQKSALNAFSLEEFYLQLQKDMWLSRNILIEYPFYQRHKDRLQSLIDTYGYQAFTIYLHGDLKTIYERGVRRDADTERHPGHLTDRYHIEDFRRESLKRQQAMSYENFCRMFEKKNYDIRIGRTIGVDVTDIGAIPYGKVVEEIKKLIQEREEQE